MLNWMSFGGDELQEVLASFSGGDAKPEQTLRSPQPRRVPQRLDGETTDEHLQRIAGWFSESIDSGSGRIDRGWLSVADQEFTAPTFSYRFEDGRAHTTEKVLTGGDRLGPFRHIRRIASNVK